MECLDESDAPPPVANKVMQNQNIVMDIDCAEKKSVFWMGGVMDCFSTVFSVFGKSELKQAMEDDWEVPFESISDLVYLGSGAQGVVFGGNLRGEMIAVKKLREKSETNIKHLRKLNHENIVRFRGVCTADPYYCVLMEYCQYGPLFDFLHSGARFSPKQILKWAKEIAHGMAYLHSHKIIHRDLKSPNVLIGDNLVVKVSDFGTSREWNDVSTIMSFTGTVAWMAPEVIRHEPCSERVDVWSYGVVLWELLTQEVPYRSMETHAIMWGVGTDTISLPVPAACPRSARQLLAACWSRVPRNRPPFKIIAAHLEVGGEDLAAIPPQQFHSQQDAWRDEILTSMHQFYTRYNEDPAERRSREESDEEKDPARHEERMARTVYEQQMNKANELYLEVCAIRLQLEQRERALAERERLNIPCRCARRAVALKLARQSSSSSDGHRKPLQTTLEFQRRRRRHNLQLATPPSATKMVVRYDERKSNEAKTVTAAVTNDTSYAGVDDSFGNNNLSTVKPNGTTAAAPAPAVVKKDTIATLEPNGSFDPTDLYSQIDAPSAANDNHIPEIAHV